MLQKFRTVMSFLFATDLAVAEPIDIEAETAACMSRQGPAVMLEVQQQFSGLETYLDDLMAQDLLPTLYQSEDPDHQLALALLLPLAEDLSSDDDGEDWQNLTEADWERIANEREQQQQALRLEQLEILQRRQQQHPDRTDGVPLTAILCATEPRVDAPICATDPLEQWRQIDPGNGVIPLIGLHPSAGLSEQQVNQQLLEVAASMRFATAGGQYSLLVGDVLTDLVAETSPFGENVRGLAWPINFMQEFSIAEVSSLLTACSGTGPGDPGLRLDICAGVSESLMQQRNSLAMREAGKRLAETLQELDPGLIDDDILAEAEATLEALEQSTKLVPLSGCLDLDRTIQAFTRRSNFEIAAKRGQLVLFQSLKDDLTEIVSESLAVRSDTDGAGGRQLRAYSVGRSEEIQTAAGQLPSPVSGQGATLDGGDDQFGLAQIIATARQPLVWLLLLPIVALLLLRMRSRRRG